MPEKAVQKEPGKKPKPQQEVIVHVPLSKLQDFPNHPFKVRTTRPCRKRREHPAVRVLVPAIVRPREDGGYEIIAGHRRRPRQ
jgi:ParB family chromosome partitioning protein